MVNRIIVIGCSGPNSLNFLPAISEMFGQFSSFLTVFMGFQVKNEIKVSGTAAFVLLKCKIERFGITFS